MFLYLKWWLGPWMKEQLKQRKNDHIVSLIRTFKHVAADMNWIIICRLINMKTNHYFNMFVVFVNSGLSVNLVKALFRGSSFQSTHVNKQAHSHSMGLFWVVVKAEQTAGSGKENGFYSPASHKSGTCLSGKNHLEWHFLPWSSAFFVSTLVNHICDSMAPFSGQVSWWIFVLWNNYFPKVLLRVRREARHHFICS